MTRNHRQVERRPDSYVNKTVTKIWQEQPSAENPYIAENCYCHGYEQIELMAKANYCEMFFLLFCGELPTRDQHQLLEQLMIALINPGPRHPATRAAMTTSVSKARLAHVLPVSLSVLGGEHLGATEVEYSLGFISEHCNKDPQHVAQQRIDEQTSDTSNLEHIAPGFGSRFGGIDIMPHKIVSQLLTLPAAGKNLNWGDQFAKALHPQQQGWLMTGVAAAALGDLGFHPRAVVGLYQLLSAPGLLAHSLELDKKPFSAMPFPADEDYYIERK